MTEGARLSNDVRERFTSSQFSCFAHLLGDERVARTCSNRQTLGHIGHHIALLEIFNIHIQCPSAIIAIILVIVIAMLNAARKRP